MGCEESDMTEHKIQEGKEWGYEIIEGILSRILFYPHALLQTSLHTIIQIKKRRSRESNPPKVICL